MEYWERLSDLKLYSLECRRDRYMIICLWKLSQGLVNGYHVTFILSERKGRLILPNRVVARAQAMVRRARESSLGVKREPISSTSFQATFVV